MACLNCPPLNCVGATVGCWLSEAEKPLVKRFSNPVQLEFVNLLLLIHQVGLLQGQHCTVFSCIRRGPDIRVTKDMGELGRPLVGGELHVPAE